MKSKIFCITQICIALTFILILVVADSAKATIIDSFDFTYQSVRYSNPTSTVATAVGESIGGYRRMDFLSQKFNNNDIAGNYSSLIADGVPSDVLSYNNSSRIKSKYIITWDANGLGLNKDITDGSSSASLMFEILSSDLGGINITFTIYNTITKYATKSLLNAGIATYSVPLSSFTYFGGMTYSDMTNVKKITMELDTIVASQDLTLDYIRTWGPPNIPEPATLMLIGGGLVAIAFYGRFKFRSNKK